MLTIDVNGTLWTNVGGWQHASVPSPWKPTISAAVINSTQNVYMVVLNDNSIWTYNGTTWMQPTNGGCCALSIAADNQGTFYVLGTDGNAYHYNGNGYDKLNGPGGFSGGYGGLANGGSMNVWGVGPTSGGNNVYRFSDTGAQHVRTISGSSTCDENHFPQCGTTIHTAKLQAGWNSRMGVQHSAQSYANGSLAVSASADQNDLFTCLENATACQPTTSGKVTCPVVGTLFNDSANSSTQYELATTLEKMRSTQVPPGGTCVRNTAYVNLCEYDTIAWCTAATSPPDLNPTGVQRVFKATYPTYWKVFALCERPGAGFGWSCFPPTGVASLGARLPDNYPLQNCTKHP